jgi:histidine kinase
LRILVSYIAMLLIPLILTCVAAAIIGAFFIGGFLSSKPIGVETKSILSYFEKNNRVLQQINIDAASHPQNFHNLDYAKSTDEVLKTYNSGIIIEEDGVLKYISKNTKNSQLVKQIQNANWTGKDIEALSLNFTGSSEKMESIKNISKLYAVNRYKYTFNGNNNGFIYMFTEISPLKEFILHYFTTFVAVLIIILIFTNMLLTYLVSRSIIKPLEYLKKAANEIKNGNLNYKVSYKAKDEIGELSSAFEEMRIKLKESIEVEQQYEQNRKELVSNISHDLKTPITAVKGYVEGIIDGVADTPDKMDKYIKTIYTKTNEIDKLIDELFLYSKLDLKKLAFNFEKVDIKKYIDHCVEELSFDLESKGVTLSFTSYCKEDIVVIADREKLNRVIMNIIYNSVKYMDMDKGKINIELHEEANEAVIKIIDNGRGISEAKVPFIFERFYRADSSRNSNMGGSGLGLSISKHIIEEHGGIIWAQSKKGVGTTIAFTLKKMTEEV